jgi:hypothetical protein
LTNPLALAIAGGLITVMRQVVTSAYNAREQIKAKNRKAEWHLRERNPHHIGGVLLHKFLDDFGRHMPLNGIAVQHERMAALILAGNKDGRVI